MKRFLFLFLSVMFFFTNVRFVSAQTSDTYMWQYLKPVNISNADDLKAKLEKEVQEVVNAGHLAPFRGMYGEQDAQPYAHYFWYHRYDTIYTLSLAYPYLSPTLQNSVKTYLKNEMTTYPLWSATLLDVGTGTKREPDELTASERYALPAGYSTRPKLFALYALWLYAHNTGDWTYIDNNWSTIKSFYTSNSSEVGQHYTSIAGAIGVARMAREKPTPDTTFYQSLQTPISNGLTSGKNFATFSLNAENAYKGGFIGDFQNWTRTSIYLGFQFLDITPEIGRYMYTDASLKSSVLGTSSDTYSITRGETRFPMWYLAQAPHFSRYFAEGSGLAPDTKAMIFPAKVWIQKVPTSTLRLYLDVPDSLVGDYYYMQNLTRTIEAHGTECWEDITTTAQECSNTQATPTVSLKPGDANNDNKVDGIDYITWLNNYNTTTTSGASKGDFNSDGKVDGIDYITWLTNYGS